MPKLWHETLAPSLFEDRDPLDLYLVTYGGEMRPAVIGQMMLVAVIGKMMSAVIGPVTRESLLHVLLTFFLSYY